ncbi:MAG: RecQ family ATP-dependent DNA helicase [Spirochaetia bacterium]|nr:RecQ family ATP-dependent DNA helicase [Spirochaetia bacterium]
MKNNFSTDINIYKKKLNIAEFRSSQESIINDILSGRHCLVIMPTGMGKSICFQLPALVFDGLTVVISPLISLMHDQVAQLKNNDINAAYINSSLSKEKRIKTYNQLSKGDFKILYVSPERFRKTEFIKAIKNRKVSLLAIDEAHCISQWGHDFRPDYTKINEFRKQLGNPATIALTATATLDTQKDIIKQLGFLEDDIHIYNEGICRPNLFLGVKTAVDEPSKNKMIINEIKNKNENTIVYFNLIKNIEKFSHLLDVNKIPHEIYHGKLPAERRKKVQNDFIKSNNTVLLATNAFGMGIDKADIRNIIHAELPASLEAYYQEIGRAGRDGKPSFCNVFYNEDDLAVLLDFIEWENPDKNFIGMVYQTMKNLGDKLASLDYEQLQSKVVYKNRGDQRLQTVLNIFERHNVTKGDIEKHSLKLINTLPDELQSEEYLELKKKKSLQRLYQMLQYSKTNECRRKFIYHYFNAKFTKCDNCDICFA